MAVIERPVSTKTHLMRSVEIGDAQQILALRLDESLNKFLNDTDPSISLQEAWITNQRKAPNDYYFCLIANGLETPEGFVGLYNIDETTAEWGRWVFSKSATSAALSAGLIFEFGFSLGLEEIECNTLIGNSAVVAWHDRLPYSQRTEDDRFVKHVLFASDYANFMGVLQILINHQTKKRYWNQ